MLHIDFFLLIAREGEIQLVKISIGLQGREFVLVEEIAIALLVAEEKPILSLGFSGTAFVS